MSNAARSVAVLFMLLLISVASSPASAGRLAEIRARGALRCGIWPQVAGFAIERNGQYSGFDIDICRAIAAGIFGDASKIAFVPLETAAEFAKRTDVDLALRRLTATPGREQSSGMVFGPVTFFDGQGFLVPRQDGIKSAAELAAQRVCVLNVERHPETLRNYFRDAVGQVRMVMVENDEAAEQALHAERCRAYSADISWLAAARSRFSGGPGRYEILPDLISKEPLAPLMRTEDSDLVQLVRWTVYALLEAEELGLNSRNLAARSTSPRTRAFMATHPGVGVALGSGDWVRAIILTVGNYGEIFERNLGNGIQLDRGLNRLWNSGGLLYALPLDR